MIITRVRDGAVLDAIVSKPFTQARASRNIVRTLAESEYAVTQYVEPELRSGEFQISFATYVGANAARDFFLAPSDFEFHGTATAATGYVVQDGYIVLAGSGIDPAMAVRFTVTSGSVTVSSDGPVWLLTVPYQETVNL